MFFRVMKDMVDEFRGIDVEERYRLEREQKEKELKAYKEKNFVPKSIKRYIYIIGGAFALYGTLMIIGEFRGGRIGMGILTTVQLLMALAGVVMVRIEDRSIQKIGLGLFLGFMAIQFIKTFYILA